MARIRTIKPEFWTDDKVVQVSFPARLLFIGLWNFADDSGNLENSPVQIKMRILPADSVSVPPLLQELTSVGLLREYSVGDKNYLNIPGFTSHQVINKPSKTRLPLPPAPGVLPDGRERNGRERKGREGKGSTSFAPTPEKDNGSGSKPKPWVNLISWSQDKGCFEGITPEIIEKWEKAYPAVDLNSQLNRADEWLKANPTKQKKNYYRFVINWLARAQERGGR